MVRREMILGEKAERAAWGRAAAERGCPAEDAGNPAGQGDKNEPIPAFRDSFLVVWAVNLGMESRSGLVRDSSSQGSPMSNLRINCPRCHASLHVNRHQEQSGHLGCTQCGQLIRLAPRMSSAPTLATPMVAPAMQTGAYWNQSPQSRKQSNAALWAVAIASLGMFLTVLTLCVTFLLWQKQQAPSGNQLADDDRGGFIPPGKEEPPAPIQPAVNEQAPPEVAEQAPAPPPAAPPAEDPLGRNRNDNAGFLPPGAESAPPAPPAPQRPGPFAANRPTKAPPPEPIPLPEPERPKPAAGNKIIN